MMKYSFPETIIGVLILGALSFNTLSASVAGEWSNWRGPNSDGTAAPGQTLPLEFSDSERVHWKAAIPGRGHSTPVVMGDRIFLTTAHEQEETQSVLCYRFDDGELLWEKVLIEGELPSKIHRKNTHASPSIATDGERIFALFHVKSEELRLFALDFEGEEVWRKNVGRFSSDRGFGYGTSPVVAAGNVIIASDTKGKGYIAAFDGVTGKEAWRTERRASTASYGTPVLAMLNGQEQILINGADRVASYNPTTGRELWSVKGGDPLIANTVVWKDGRVFASGGYPGRETWAIDVATREVVWSEPVKCYEQSMIVVDDFLYGIAEGGVVHCWEVATGNLLWRERLTKGPESASPVFAGGHIYHANEEGVVFVIKPNPEELELVAENQVGEEIFATPAITRNRILIRSASYDGQDREEFLYSIGL